MCLLLNLHNPGLIRLPVPHEISLKMHQKAAKILLVPPYPLHLHHDRVLVTSLVQVLAVWVLLTLLQLASLRPYPGQDLLLASLGLAAAKLALVTRLLDLGVSTHIIGLAALLSSNPHGSILAGAGQRGSFDHPAW